MCRAVPCPARGVSCRAAAAVSASTAAGGVGAVPSAAGVPLTPVGAAGLGALCLLRRRVGGRGAPRAPLSLRARDGPGEAAGGKGRASGAARPPRPRSVWGVAVVVGVGCGGRRCRAAGSAVWQRRPRPGWRVGTADGECRQSLTALPAAATPSRAGNGAAQSCKGLRAEG